MTNRRSAPPPRLRGQAILFPRNEKPKAWWEFPTLTPSNYLDYVDAYREAAQTLYRSSVQSRWLGKRTYLPIAFLWRHYLELILKSILDRLSASDLERSEVWKDHNLEGLWRRVSRAFTGFWPLYEPEEHARVRDLILQFHNVDRLSFGFRYPVGRDGKTIPLAADLGTVDLATLHKNMCGLATLLEDALGATDDWDERQTNGLATPFGIDG